MEMNNLSSSPVISWDPTGNFVAFVSGGKSPQILTVHQLHDNMGASVVPKKYLEDLSSSPGSHVTFMAWGEKDDDSGVSLIFLGFADGRIDVVEVNSKGEVVIGKEFVGRHKTGPVSFIDVRRDDEEDNSIVMIASGSASDPEVLIWDNTRRGQQQEEPGWNLITAFHIPRVVGIARLRWSPTESDGLRYRRVAILGRAEDGSGECWVAKVGDDGYRMNKKGPRLSCSVMEWRRGGDQILLASVGPQPLLFSLVLCRDVTERSVVCQDGAAVLGAVWDSRGGNVDNLVLAINRETEVRCYDLSSGESQQMAARLWSLPSPRDRRASFCPTDPSFVAFAAGDSRFFVKKIDRDLKTVSTFAVVAIEGDEQGDAGRPQLRTRRSYREGLDDSMNPVVALAHLADIYAEHDDSSSSSSSSSLLTRSMRKRRHEEYEASINRGFLDASSGLDGTAHPEEGDQELQEFGGEPANLDDSFPSAAASPVPQSDDPEEVYDMILYQRSIMVLPHLPAVVVGGLEGIERATLGQLIALERQNGRPTIGALIRPGSIVDMETINRLKMATIIGLIHMQNAIDGRRRRPDRFPTRSTLIICREDEEFLENWLVSATAMFRDSTQQFHPDLNVASLSANNVVIITYRELEMVTRGHTMRRMKMRDLVSLDDGDDNDEDDPRAPAILRVRWARVVADSAESFLTPTSRTWQAVCLLKARARCAFSYEDGDFYQTNRCLALLRYLRLRPFDDLGECRKFFGASPFRRPSKKMERLVKLNQALTFNLQE